MRICKLDGGGGERPRILCAFCSRSSCLYGTVRSYFLFFVLLHVTLSFTSACSFTKGIQS